MERSAGQRTIGGALRMRVVRRLLRWNSRAAIIGVMVAAVTAMFIESPFSAIIFGLIAYFGVINIKTSTDDSSRNAASLDDSAERVALSLDTAEQKIAGMRALNAHIDRESTREIVTRICDQSDEVVRLMRGDGDKAKAAPMYLEQLLEPGEAMLETYVRLKARGLMTTNEIVARTERQDLPMIERASRLFRDRLQSDDRVDGKELAQILSFNVESPTPIVEPRRG